jgi:hypothetical protein
LSFAPADQSARQLATGGYYLNLFNVPGIDMSAPWWDQKCVSDLTIDGKLFFCISDMVILPYQMAWVLLFNRVLIEDLDLPDPYDFVRDGTWTLDVMLELVRAAALDVDGSGVWGRGDRFGFASNASVPNSFLLGASIIPIVKDSDGVPTLIPPSSRDIEAIDKIWEIMNPANGNHFRIAQNQEHEMLASREALFTGNNMTIIEQTREMEDSFGIIPFPKMNAEQGRYYANMGVSTPVLGIPVTADNPERTGNIVSAMSAVSMETLRPAYFEYTLNLRRVRDEDTLEMLEIIADSRIFSIGHVFGWGITASYNDNIANRSPESITTLFDRIAGTTQASIDATLRAFDALD